MRWGLLGAAGLTAVLLSAVVGLLTSAFPAKVTKDHLRLTICVLGLLLLLTALLAIADYRGQRAQELKRLKLEIENSAALLPLKLKLLSGVDHRPSALLSPDAAIVSFRAYAAELETLRNWTRPDDQRRFFMLVGETLVGKTRIISELARLNGGEIPHYRLMPGRERIAWDLLVRANNPCIVALELNEWTTDVAYVLEAAANQALNTIKVVVIGRRVSLFEGRLSRLSDQARFHLYESANLQQGALLPVGNSEDRERWRIEARSSFLFLLPKAPTLKARREITGARVPMGVLQALALAQALSDQAGVAAHTPEDVFLHLAQWEARLWPAVIDPNESPLLAARAVSAAWVRGNVDRHGLESTIRLLPELADASHERRDAVANWLLRTFPGANQSVFEPPIEIISIAVLLQVVEADPSFLESVARKMSYAKVAARLEALLETALVVRGARDVAESLLSVLRLTPQGFTELLEYAAAPWQLDPLFAGALEILDLNTEEINEYVESAGAYALPDTSEVLLRKKVAASRENKDDVVLVEDLIELADFLVRRRNPNDAFQYVEESVGLARDLNLRPAVASPALLVRSLTCLANVEIESNNAQRSLAVVQEAVAVWDRDIHAPDDSARHDLLHALSGMAGALRRANLREEAVAVSRRLVTVAHDLADDSPERETDRIQALIEFAENLMLNDEHFEAANVAEEAIERCRDFIEGFRNDATELLLAHTLSGAASVAAFAGSNEQALPLIDEAIDLQRPLLSRNWELATGLERSLLQRSMILRKLGDQDRAIESSAEAVAVRRRGDLMSGQTDSVRLATTLYAYAQQLAGTSRRDDAMRFAAESVRLRRELASDNPTPTNIHDLLQSLPLLSYLLSMSGDPEALVVSSEGVDWARRQTGDSKVFDDDLGLALWHQAMSLSQAGFQEKAIPLLEESLSLRRLLYARDPARYADVLESTLDRYIYALERVGRSRDADVLRRELESTLQGKLLIPETEGNADLEPEVDSGLGQERSGDLDIESQWRTALFEVIRTNASTARCPENGDDVIIASPFDVPAGSGLRLHCPGCGAQRYYLVTSDEVDDEL